MSLRRITLYAIGLWLVALGGHAATLSGPQVAWQPLTLTFTGPASSETATPNPFTDYRLTVTFSHSSGQRYAVPGYFAADGDSAETSAASGDQWRVHFTPDAAGEWQWQASFVSGSDVAVAFSGGTPTAPIDGQTGRFTVAPRDPNAPGFYAKGRLAYVGKHHLQHLGSGDYFLKIGADAPENLLGYIDFDNTYDQQGGALKRFEAHLQDWQSGDPSWQGGLGKGLIGALNYLAAEGQNAFSFLTYNAGGDGKDVWPFIAPDEPLRYDVSKLAQWEIVFSHADRLGLYLHFKTQETENDNNNQWALDNGAVGLERKLYYRELVARFGHHLALNWNLGEENTQTTTQRQEMAQYLREIDPYDHHIVIHTYPNQQDSVYRPLLGSASELTGASLQNSWNQVHQRTLQWLAESRAAGKPWVVANDEQGGAGVGAPPDIGYNGYGGTSVSQDDIRHQTLWGNLLAGGAGVEYYFGYQQPCDDLDCEDWRSRDRLWDYNRYAHQFFMDNALPFWTMRNCNDLIGNYNNSSSPGYCFGQSGELYVIYLASGSGGVALDLPGSGVAYSVDWYDPRNGGGLRRGTVETVGGGAAADLGLPPNEQRGADWVALVRRSSGTPPEPEPEPEPTGELVVALIDAERDSIVLAEVADGAVIDRQALPDLEQFSLALVQYPATTQSVVFQLTGPVTSSQTENILPYAAFGDSNGDYSGELLQEGDYRLNVTAYGGKNASGATLAASTIDFAVVAEVVVPNLPPQAAFTATPVTGSAPLTVTFDATDSSDSDGTLASIAWAFGDGNRASGLQVSHTYPEAGEYTATLTVVDDDGASASVSLLVSVASPPPSSGTVLAINAGGPAFTAADGVVYGADSGAVGGRTYRIASNRAIANTSDDPLYRSERYGNFSYGLPLANGSYELTLQFAEIYWNDVNKRRFDVVVEGETAVIDLDILAVAGKDAAYDVLIPVEVSDGQLDIVFSTRVNNAKLSALRVAAVASVDNEPPSILGDSFEVLAGESTLLDVLANDSDPDQGPQPLTLVGLGDRFGSTEGEVVIENNQVRYTPPAGWSDGFDVFSYDVTDGVALVTEVVVFVYIIAPEIQGLNAAYYDAIDFTGLATTRVDEVIDFNWGTGAPASGMAGDTFSSRWRGEVEALGGGSYQLHVKTNDGMRLWLDGQLVIDEWYDHIGDHSTTVTLAGGQRYSLCIEHYEGVKTALARLDWTPPGASRGLIPTAQLFAVGDATRACGQ